MKKLIIIFLSIFLLTACGKKEETKNPLVRPVKTMVVQKQKTYTERSFPGKILASQEAKLSFQVPGQIMKMKVREGDRVKKGQLVAVLDDEKFKSAVDEAEAKYIRTKAEYQRASRLVKDAYISRTEFDRKKSQFIVAKSNLERAQRDLRDTKLKIPFDGVIAERYAEKFEYVKAKQAIVNLHDVRQIDVEINVPETIMMHLKEAGDNTDDVVAVFDNLPGKKFAVKFKKMQTQADRETQTYRVILTMPAPQQALILPGMTVTVKAKIPDFKSGGKDFFIIPSSAVFYGKDKKPSVWLVNKENMTVKLIPVAVSRLTKNDIHVTKGLKPGDRIVTGGVHYLKQGEKVSLMD